MYSNNGISPIIHNFTVNRICGMYMYNVPHVSEIQNFEMSHLLLPIE